MIITKPHPRPFWDVETSCDCGACIECRAYVDALKKADEVDRGVIFSGGAIVSLSKGVLHIAVRGKSKEYRGAAINQIDPKRVAEDEFVATLVADLIRENPKYDKSMEMRSEVRS